MNGSTCIVHSFQCQLTVTVTTFYDHVMLLVENTWLVPRPLPDFISQQWRKTRDKSWSGLRTRVTVYVITKNVHFPQAKCLLRRHCSDLSLATIMFPLCTSRGSKSCQQYTYVHDDGMCMSVYIHWYGKYSWLQPSTADYNLLPWQQMKMSCGSPNWTLFHLHISIVLACLKCDSTELLLRVGLCIVNIEEGLSLKLTDPTAFWP